MWPNSAGVRKMEGLKCFFPFQEHDLLSSLSTQELWSTFLTPFTLLLDLFLPKQTYFNLAVQNAYVQSYVCKFQCQYYQIHEP